VKQKGRDAPGVGSSVPRCGGMGEVAWTATTLLRYAFPAKSAGAYARAGFKLSDGKLIVSQHVDVEGTESKLFAKL